MQIAILNKDGGDGQEELALIELQGNLESRLGSNVDKSGKFIGDLHFTKDGTVPILIIGHHILYGKAVKLENPMIVIKKKKIPNETTEYLVESIIKKKLLFKTRPKPIIASVPKKG
jgi:chromosome transmission fidelity protein 8